MNENTYVIEVTTAWFSWLPIPVTAQYSRNCPYTEVREFFDVIAVTHKRLGVVRGDDLELLDEAGRRPVLSVPMFGWMRWLNRILPGG